MKERPLFADIMNTPQSQQLQQQLQQQGQLLQQGTSQHFQQFAQHGLFPHNIIVGQQHPQSVRSLDNYSIGVDAFSGRQNHQQSRGGGWQHVGH